jgi:hypothetical protein
VCVCVCVCVTDSFKYHSIAGRSDPHNELVAYPRRDRDLVEKADGVEVELHASDARTSSRGSERVC